MRERPQAPDLSGLLLAITEKSPTKTAEFQGNLVAMNESLMMRSMRQHHLTEVATSANARLQKEILERKEVEAALRESEKRYRILFDLGPVAIYSCDASGVIQKFNRQAAKLWGRKPVAGDTSERFCGSFKLFRTDGSFLPHPRCPMAAVVRGKKTSVQGEEVVIERPDGSRVVAIVDIRPLKNKQGKITGGINCFYDITERKEAEAAQRRLLVLTATNRKLELEISQRRAAEQALKDSEQHQRRLLQESRHMRDQLRLLSRQLLQAQEQERKRISRELHDVIAQSLTGINLHLATLKGDTAMNTQERERNIVVTQKLVAQAVNVVHQFARELRPTALDDIGLVPALCSFMKAFKEETGIHVTLSAFANVKKLEGDKRIVLYRIVQEALANVARHALASRVDVSIEKADGAICMKIKDNGKGLPKERLWNSKKIKRLGLIGMRERLEMIGGQFAIESQPGEGTTVTARIPLGNRRGDTNDLPLPRRGPRRAKGPKSK